MTKQEFEARAIKVSDKEFEAINEVYMNCDLDKDEFCKVWKKMNQSRVKAYREQELRRIETEEKVNILMDTLAYVNSVIYDLNPLVTGTSLAINLLSKGDIEDLKFAGIEMEVKGYPCNHYKTRKSPKAKETETATAETAKEPQQTVATSAPTEQAAEPTTDKSKEEVKKEFTEEDVRAAMHKTRQRIEGEDYKEHTDSEAYKKYHKELTSMFKNIAATLGAEKPSTLEAGKREDFIKACDDLAILEDGTIGYTIPLLSLCPEFMHY